MQLLNSKLNYLRDLTVEHHSSLQSLNTVAEANQHLLDILEKQIALRNREKTGFVTRVGVALREGLLQHYNSMVNQVQQYYCSAYELHSHLTQQHHSLLEVVQQAQPLISEIQMITHHHQHLSNSLKTVVKREEVYRNCRQRTGSQPLNRPPRCQKENQKNAGNTTYRLNLINIDRNGKESLMEMSQRIEQTQIFEVNQVLEECIKSLGDLTFLHPYTSQPRELSYPYLTPQNPTTPAPTFGRDKTSLGLESKTEQQQEINLFCDEDIGHLATPKMSLDDSLQRITEQDEQQQESDTPRGFKHRNLSVH